MNIDLKGKVAVITGSSKGIGASIARNLADCGASVVINYNSDKAGADRLLAEIEAQGGTAIAVQANVADAVDVKRLFATAAEAYGDINLLVNNAGTFKFTAVENITEEDFYQTYNVNILGLLLTTQEVIKHFPSSGGNIINISSVAGQNPGPYTSLYSSTKAAVNAITISLSKELGSRNIRVNAIAPGITDTDGARGLGILGTDAEKGMVAATPMGRIGRPEDIAPIVTFLTSEEASWITGEIIGVSGGAK